MSSFPERLSSAPQDATGRGSFSPATPQAAVLLGWVCDRGAVAFSFGQERVNLPPNLPFWVSVQSPLRLDPGMPFYSLVTQHLAAMVSGTKGTQEIDDYQTAHHSYLGYETCSVL